MASGRCGSAIPPNNQTVDQRITYVLGSEPGNIDPHVSSEDDTAIINRQIYDTLVYRNPSTQEIVAGLASQWTISTDGLVYTFSLRQGVFFHDGTPLNAEAVAQNFDRIINVSESNAKAALLIKAYYRGYSILDEYSIQLQLLQPYAPFLNILSQPYFGMASPTAFQQYSQERYQFHQVGTGPYILEDYIPGKNIILKRNLQYSWGPSFYVPVDDTSASVDEVEFQFVPNNRQRLEMINNREADIVTNLLPTDARALTSNTNVQLVPVQLAGQPLQFLINTNRFPTDNIAFRRALIFSANRNFIVDTVLQRFSSVAWSPLTANMPFYNRNLVGAYAPDTGQAQSLLLSSGYADTNGDKFLDFAGVDAAITIVIQSRDLYSEMAQELVDQWRLLGIKTELVSVPTLSALTARIETNQYNLVAFSTHASDPTVLNDFFTQTGRYNWSNVADASLEGLLGQGMSANDEATRQSIYAQVQQQIMDQAMILPLADPIRLDASLTNVLNLEFDSLGVPFLSNVRLSS
ncbi:MAG: ABC transporter substrate-binding protein [Chloroflexi bacterium]|nr:ABC transporter substrate-binding protein [Chloroflexota bacterium]MCC6891327.1 hypothetical protein [Anaerolineae bacterium]